jgi:GMP synthase-like glutamine amidotransferase
MIKYYLASSSMAMSLSAFLEDVMEWQQVDSLEDADILAFSGGADIDPALYDEPKHWSTHAWPERDYAEYEDLLMFQAMGKSKVLGICRGAQFLTAVTGGKLIQNVNNHAGYRHMMSTYDGQEVRVNSVHHQMCLPNMEITTMLGWAECTATKLEGLPKDQQHLSPGTFPEPEAFRIRNSYAKETERAGILRYEELDALCFQYHPEFSSIPADGLAWTKQTTLEWLQS